jgi:hypothetical protein
VVAQLAKPARQLAGLPEAVASFMHATRPSEGAGGGRQAFCQKNTVIAMQWNASSED